MNRVPVIKISQSSSLRSIQPRLPVSSFQRILPAPAPSPITVIPVSRLQNMKKIDPSNNIEKNIIKTEPTEESDTQIPSTIPFHDIANQTAIIKSFPFTVTTTSSTSMSTEIKKE